MNYIVFVNKGGFEKLAIKSNVKTYYDINADLLNIINNICATNDYCFRISSSIGKHTAVIEEKLFYKVN